MKRPKAYRQSSSPTSCLLMSSSKFFPADGSSPNTSWVSSGPICAVMVWWGASGPHDGLMGVRFRICNYILNIYYVGLPYSIGALSISSLNQRIYPYTACNSKWIKRRSTRPNHKIKPLALQSTSVSLTNTWRCARRIRR